ILVLLLFRLASTAYGKTQAASLQHLPAPKLSDKQANPAEAELAKRIATANAARTTGDPAAVAAANKRLIALGLRELGQLRLVELAYPQAIELYRSSLDFEDNPETRVDLAITLLQANRLDDAVAESDKALAVDPNNV